MTKSDPTPHRNCQPRPTVGPIFRSSPSPSPFVLLPSSPVGSSYRRQLFSLCHSPAAAVCPSLSSAARSLLHRRPPPVLLRPQLLPTHRRYLPFSTQYPLAVAWYSRLLFSHRLPDPVATRQLQSCLHPPSRCSAAQTTASFSVLVRFSVQHLPLGVFDRRRSQPVSPPLPAGRRLSFTFSLSNRRSLSPSAPWPKTPSPKQPSPIPKSVWAQLQSSLSP